VVRLRAEGVPASAALAFVLASSLLNPQMFLLTAGAFGMRFALAQLGCVLGLSMGVGLWLAGQDSAVHPEGGDRDGAAVERQTSCRAQVVGLAGHVGLHFSIGVLVGASLRVLLPWLGIVDWIGNRGWLSSPLLGWMGAPFYTCGGSAIPLARSLLQSGFSPGALFTFLLVGPALRGTTLANLSCLLPKRSLALCLVALSLGGGLLGYAFEVLVGVL
jgi:uncharacterized membrane protein YraQ (UPF0718 family)